MTTRAQAFQDPYNQTSERLGTVERELASTRTELAAVARQTAEALEQVTHGVDLLRKDLGESVTSLRQDFTNFQNQTRPNLLGVLGALVSVVGLIGALSFAFLNARVSPVEHDILGFERENHLKHDEIDVRLSAETRRNEERHQGQQRQVQVVMDRLDIVGDRISRNDSRIEELQRNDARFEERLARQFSQTEDTGKFKAQIEDLQRRMGQTDAHLEAAILRSAPSSAPTINPLVIQAPPPPAPSGRH